MDKRALGGLMAIDIQIRQIAVERVTVRCGPGLRSMQLGTLRYGDNVVLRGRGEFVELLAVNGVPTGGFIALRWTKGNLC